MGSFWSLGSPFGNQWGSSGLGQIANKLDPHVPIFFSKARAQLSGPIAHRADQKNYSKQLAHVRLRSGNMTLPSRRVVTGNLPTLGDNI